MKHAMQKGLFCAGVAIMIAVLGGCIHQVPPPKDDPDRNVARRFDDGRKIPARVGIYLDKGVDRYTYWHYRMGMVFRIEAGKCLMPVSMKMASTAFEEVVPVASLPPYLGSYIPDVDAVILPELLYFFTGTEGNVKSLVESLAGLRMRIFDLNGNTLWQGEASGESSSERLDLIQAVINGRTEALGESAYAAIASAAEGLRRKLVKEKSEGLALLREYGGRPASGQAAGSRSTVSFEEFFNTGLTHFKNKEYQLALRSFKEAQKVNSADPYARFYAGVCYVYTGHRVKALEELNEVLRNGSNDKLARDCRKWIGALERPLRVGFVFLEGPRGTPNPEGSRVILENLSVCAVYEAQKLDAGDVGPLLNDRRRLVKYLDTFGKKGINIVVFIESRERCERVVADGRAGSASGDISSEFSLRVSASVYSTRKKKLHAQFTLDESATRLVEGCPGSSVNVFQDLYKRSADKIVLRLLDNNLI